MMTLVQVDQGDVRVKADFSAGSALSVTPVLNGDLANSPDGHPTCFASDVTFDLLWLNMGLKQTIELPVEYANITLNKFQGHTSYAQKEGNVLTTGLLPLNQIVDNLSPYGNEINFYFGRTESTYMDYGIVPGNAPVYHIKSQKFELWTMKPPLSGETIIITSTIEYDNEKIIQL